MATRAPHRAQPSPRLPQIFASTSRLCRGVGQIWGGLSWLCNAKGEALGGRTPGRWHLRGLQKAAPRCSVQPQHLQPLSQRHQSPRGSPQPAADTGVPEPELTHCCRGQGSVGGAGIEKANSSRSADPAHRKKSFCCVFFFLFGFGGIFSSCFVFFFF